MEQLKVIIVDDEVSASNNLHKLLETYCPGVEIVGIAAEIPEAVQLITDLKPDVVFLDIELKRGTGFDLLQCFSQINFEVIFVTAYQEYALKAIKQSALDYILKPVDIEELRQAVDKAKKIIAKQENSKSSSTTKRPVKVENERLVLHSAIGFTIIHIKDLMYCKADGNYLHFICFDGKDYFVTKNMKEYDELLSPYGFFRIHHGYLVNLRAVKQFLKTEGGVIILNNGLKLPVAVRKRTVFLKRMAQLDFPIDME